MSSSGSLRECKLGIDFILVPSLRCFRPRCRSVVFLRAPNQRAPAPNQPKPFPQISPASCFRTLEREMDEFDLMAQRSAAFDSLPEDRKRAISSLQSAFLAA